MKSRGQILAQYNFGSGYMQQTVLITSNIFFSVLRYNLRVLRLTCGPVVWQLLGQIFSQQADSIPLRVVVLNGIVHLKRRLTLNLLKKIYMLICRHRRWFRQCSQQNFTEEKFEQKKMKIPRRSGRNTRGLATQLGRIWSVWNVSIANYLNDLNF